jgi:hypothetical protein
MMSPVEARQGAGPRGMVPALVLSTVLAAVATAILAYFVA